MMRSATWTWGVAFVLMFATFLNYADRQALAVSLKELKDAHGIHEARVGWLEGAFGLAFAAGSVAFGWLADRFGPVRLYPLVLAGWSAAGLATAFVAADTDLATFRRLLACRVVLGFCEAGHWPCALLTLRQILSAKDRPLGNGMLQGGAALGAVAIPLYAEAVQQFGGSWPFVFASVGAAGLLWLPFWLVLVRRDDFAAMPKPGAEPAREAVWPRVLGLVVFISGLNVGWQFLRAWLPLFLQEHHHYSREATRFVTSGFFLATDAGCLAVGFGVQAMAARGRSVAGARLITCVACMAAASLAVAVPHAGGGAVMLAFLFLAGAGILGAHPYYYALVQELPTRNMGVISGGIAAMGWLAASAFNVGIGEEIKRANNYDLGLTLAGLAPVAGFAGLVAIRRLWV